MKTTKNIRILPAALTAIILSAQAQADIINFGIDANITPNNGDRALSQVMKDLYQFQAGLCKSETNGYCGTEKDVGYNAFRFDLSYSDIQYEIDAETGVIGGISDMEANFSFAVDVADTNQQSIWLETLNNRDVGWGGFTDAILAWQYGVPDGVYGIWGVSDITTKIDQIAGSPLDQVASPQQDDAYLQFELDASIPYMSGLDIAWFQGFFHQELLFNSKSSMSLLAGRYTGRETGLNNASQSEIDAYIADNLISGFDLSLTFSPQGVVEEIFDGVSYFDANYDVNVDVRYHHSLTATEQIIADVDDLPWRVGTLLSNGFLGLEDVSFSLTSVENGPEQLPVVREFPAPEWVQVPAPGGLGLLLIGLAALLVGRTRR